MRLIDADRLLTDKMKSMYYHLKNGDITIPIIDIEHAPTVKPVQYQESKWISVKERMPEEGVSVITWETQGFAFSDVYKDGEWEIGTPNGAIISHWMPIPELPKEVQDAR